MTFFKQRGTLLPLLGILGFSFGLSVGFSATAKDYPAVPGEYIIKFKKSSAPSQLQGGTYTAQSMDSKFSALGVEMKKSLSSLSSVFLVKSSSVALKIQSAGADETLANLKKSPDVEYAEPNFIYTVDFGPRAPKPAPAPGPTPTPPAGNPEDAFPSVFPNDSRFSGLWGMRNEGQSDSTGRRGKVTADIHAVNAWAITKGSHNVVVAIVDTGIDYYHPDLVDNLWSMPGQPNVHGYNAITNTLDPLDDNDHGTHVAGTIGAEGGNGQGVVGVNWNVSIMAVKFLGSNGSGTLANAITGIDWAREHGAKIISNSWGGGPFSQSLKDAISRARDAGILFVAAAGNDGTNNDSTPSYPASYPLDNIIAVAATNNQDQLSSFSNYGKTSVHLAAPGENILSTFPNNSYATISGTSMATPHVSGAAALLLANNPALSYSQIKARLISGVDVLSNLSGKVLSGGRLNVYKALKASKP